MFDSPRPNPYPASADPATRPLEHFKGQVLDPKAEGVTLGLFMPDMSFGQWPSTAERGTAWTYEYNRAVAQRAEELGLHFVLPPARWKGIEGDEIEYWGASFDTISMAAALAEATSRIAIMTTMHTNIIHPVVAAKICAGLDQISGGRLALNVVSGWNEDEFRSMNIPLIVERGDRYEYTREWLDIVRELWSTGRCTYKGRFFQIDDARSRPLPVQNPRPVVVNAGQSFTGMSFAAKEVDFLFTRGERAEKWREIVRGSGRTAGLLAVLRIIVRQTQEEAEEVKRDILAKVDRLAVRRSRVASGASTEADVDAWMADPTSIEKSMFDDCFVGSPEFVARQLADFINEYRPSGLCLTLYDYLPELELFGAEVMAPLKQHLADYGLQLHPPLLEAGR